MSKPRDWKALTMITCQALRDVMGRSQTGQLGPIPTQGESQGTALEAALVVPPSVRSASGGDDCYETAPRGGTRSDVTSSSRPA